jgi:predicted nucleic acid-binding protein
MSWRQPGSWLADTENNRNSDFRPRATGIAGNVGEWPVLRECFCVRISSVSQTRRRGDNRPDRCLAARRSLLDINVLIVLLDSDHVFHSASREGLSLHATDGWSSCPLTDNGCMCIMSCPNDPDTIPVSRIRDRLSEAASGPPHQFWPEDVHFLDAGVAVASRTHGPRQITDLSWLSPSGRRDVLSPSTVRL